MAIIAIPINLWRFLNQYIVDIFLLNKQFFYLNLLHNIQRDL